jgi:hypothetical protein
MSQDITKQLLAFTFLQFLHLRFSGSPGSAVWPWQHISIVRESILSVILVLKKRSYIYPVVQELHLDFI